LVPEVTVEGGFPLSWIPACDVEAVPANALVDTFEEWTPPLRRATLCATPPGTIRRVHLVELEGIEPSPGESPHAVFLRRITFQPLVAGGVPRLCVTRPGRAARRALGPMHP